MNENYSKLELSTQILINEALERNIQVDVLDMDDNFIRLKKGDKVEYVKQATKTSLDTYIAPLIMENKEVTKMVLKENNINVPDGVTLKLPCEAKENFSRFEGKDIVIKPKSTNFGKGVIILKELKNIEEFQNAVDHAFEYDSSVMIERFIPGKEYRFLVIGDETVGIIHRIPANVVGDGIHSITQLVEEKNKDPRRGKGYVKPLEKIILGNVEKDYLGFSGKNFDYIPDKDEVVYLRENSNVSTGGDSIDFTDKMIEDYKKIAVKAAKAVGAKICGADIIINDINEIPNDENHSIIELNFNPAIHMHDFPYEGENRHIEKRILDLLGY
ncbi:bifunctional glutamate--cysteine ligase GshA/glutathione synthetase GshB [Clostridium felsineum]|uniref:Glutathione biosynthesis bifunctional protein GshAB n=1 Tax=Clostridium felsineum TaxID=36839 RepID=A0A1S8LL15_9CLOT|nr:bifunctional glutamate--cysteine ligase GshA/glutathione synthetase GshB [Clostridium felsineum]MCR3759113.1 bifunctional glutamate--cysteine ligase GshA/glutathione synthetase GshB [Clostridium felsineum]URZ00409.1 Glutathione biosynthesis bifunctional protein GshAB [Clostridium felsineum]URZ06955.1 Glutathione biosynthesis bifunctional protein GshAB [Clostridium felsineum]URZ11986.1 Glutathione biosynthesis bifunctional protein GshAB [Clostridium felsineum]